MCNKGGDEAAVTGADGAGPQVTIWTMTEGDRAV